MLARLRNWWTQPCGGREVLALSLPLMISTSFWALQQFVDRMFLLWRQPEAMAAALPAGMLYWTCLCLPLGVASFVNTFVAQYVGAGRPQQVGLAVGQGIRFGWWCTPLLLLPLPAAAALFRWAGHSPAQVALETQYFQALMFGAGAAVIAAAQSAFFSGRGLMGVVMWVNLAGTLVNIALDYALIFGRAGFPELGIAGAAWATVAAQWFNVLAFWFLMQPAELRREFGLDAGRRFDPRLLRRLIKFGVPSGLPMLIEAGSFTLLTMFIASLGELYGAATSLAFNVNAVSFVPMFGIGIAVSTLVGQQLGAGREDLAARAGWSGLTLGLSYSTLFAAAYLLAPDIFLLAHAQHAEPEQFAELRGLVVVMLRFVAAYCLFDAMQIIFVGVLKGAGDTRFILLVATVVSTAGVATGRIGQAFGWHIWGWWWVLTLWILALAAAYGGRFVHGKWRSIRVIEPAEEADEPAESGEPAAPVVGTPLAVDNNEAGVN